VSKRSMRLTIEKPSCYLESMTLKSPKTFELTIPSKLEELEAVTKLIAEATAAFGLGEDVAYWLELTVSESMINAIRHGNQSDPTKDAYLSISFDGHTVEIVVEDEGEGFKLEELADPTQAENLLKPCGRGILIIKSFMDEVKLMPREGGGTRLRMIKRLPEPSA
jgi:serine/threonine-protein kinase RsbW